MSDGNLDALLKQLRRVGLRPSQELVEKILAHGEAAVAPLLALATNKELLRSGGDDLLGPIHALRLLGELRSPEIIAPLLDLFPLEEDEYPFGDELLSLWEREVPQIIARVGAAAADQLWAVARDTALPDWRRHVAIGALSHLATLETALHEQVETGLREILRSESDQTVVASAIAGLGLLNVSAAYPDVLAAYREKRVDTQIISAALARQMLLSKRPADYKSCAAHPLWERYDEHGPSETTDEASPAGRPR